VALKQRKKMADEQDLLLFANYVTTKLPKKRITLPRCNPFEQYDDQKFRERFRMSKYAVSKILEQVNNA